MQVAFTRLSPEKVERWLYIGWKSSLMCHALCSTGDIVPDIYSPNYLISCLLSDGQLSLPQSKRRRRLLSWSRTDRAILGTLFAKTSKTYRHAEKTLTDEWISQARTQRCHLIYIAHKPSIRGKEQTFSRHTKLKI